ncbi:MAG: MATE family efflux transporter [Acidobacteria bacterium]|nr:MATE family efflux transporter [Acidobacteriota bacterium]
MIAALRKELRPMVRLAAPLAMAELGWMAMGFVDVVMAGRIGPAAMGAGGVGSMLFFPIVIAGSGLMSGMDTLVSQSFGAKDERECRRALVAALWLSFAVTPLVTALLVATIPLLRAIGTNPEVMGQLDPYLKALSTSVPPLMMYSVLRRYLQARDVVRPITFAVVSANLVNFAGNWLLMYGNWGAPRLGLTGSGISTAVARAYIGLVLLVALVAHERRAGLRMLCEDLRPDPRRIWRLLALGAPAAVQIAVEGAVFGIVSVMAARLDAVSLAAHTVAVNVISITYMVPLGISAAAAVRVGQAVGRRDPKGASAAGWTALGLGSGFMGLAGIVLFLAPHAVARLYSPEAAVIAVGASLLWIAAFFELFDGLQVVATGALRGLGDTRTPAIAHFAGYWIFGLPIAWALCFRYGWGVRGLWIGLTVALILIGTALIVAWQRASR